MAAHDGEEVGDLFLELLGFVVEVREDEGVSGDGERLDRIGEILLGVDDLEEEKHHEGGCNSTKESGWSRKLYGSVESLEDGIAEGPINKATWQRMKGGEQGMRGDTRRNRESLSNCKDGIGEAAEVAVDGAVLSVGLEERGIAIFVALLMRELGREDLVQARIRWDVLAGI